MNRFRVPCSVFRVLIALLYLIIISHYYISLLYLIIISHYYISLLYSWRFSRYSAPTHWLVHGHMTSNNETVSRQMPRAGNIAKTMTSNGKQFTVTREMLTAAAGISARYSKFAFVLFCYITNHLMTGPLGNSEFCFPRISMFPSTSSRETLRFSGNKIHCSPRDQSLSVYYYISKFLRALWLVNLAGRTLLLGLLKVFLLLNCCVTYIAKFSQLI